LIFFFFFFVRFVFVIQKTLFITNSGKRLASFRIKSHGASNGNFDYHCAPGRPLASGMTAKLTVTFKCTSMEDVYELINIITTENRKIDVHVYAENPMPILKCKCQQPHFSLRLFCPYVFHADSHPIP